MENKDYLTDQIITYIGNKRQLCSNILRIKRNYFGDSKIKFLDLFAGSGIVNRCMKQDSSLVVANDLEYYSYVINKCYLANKKNISFKTLKSHIDNINEEFENSPIRGIISNNYAPKDSDNIQEGERCFYTTRNAMYIDTALSYLFKHCKGQEKYLLLGPLLYEASVHVNTGGVFKGFYKDKGTKIGKFGGTHEHALRRITGNIAITAPVLSNYTSSSRVYNKEALDFVANDNTEYDIAYLDPPYNQHPYGSNYFMLNIIAKNELDSDISQISGIPSNWNRSAFNKKGALSHLRKILDNLNSKIIIMSYNSEGIIPISEIKKTLKNYGTLKTKKIKYPTYKGSRNLKNRNYYLERATSMSYEKMFYMIKKRSNRGDIDISYADRRIKPDGGFIFVRSHDDSDFYFPILIIEMKVQGTNDIRLSEGKKKQARGNAIERLGKNLSIVRTLFASEGVTPFVCFGHGCDFDINDGKDVKTVLGKVIGMNQFFSLNTIYVNRVETKNSRGVSSIYQPVSMFF